MKRAFLVIFTIIISILTCSCTEGTNEAPKDESSASSVPSESEDSSAPKESWTETETRENERITTEYSNYGENFTRTIEKYNSVEVLVEKDEYVFVGDDAIKKTSWEYRDDGTLIRMSYEEAKDDGTLEKAAEYNDFESGLYSYGKYLYEYAEDGTEILTRSESRYKSLDSGNMLIERTIYYETEGETQFRVEDILYYKDNSIHHNTVTKTSMADASYYFDVYDAEQKNVISYYYTLGKTEQMIRCYRAKGFIQVDITQSLWVYSESHDGESTVFVAEYEVDPETGEQNASKYNDDMYTARQANKLIEEYSKLYDEAVVFMDDVDYES